MNYKLNIKTLIQLFLLGILLSIPFSCKKKCVNNGNGDYFRIEIYEGNSLLSVHVLNQIKYYYYRTDGNVDTLKADNNNPENNTVKTDLVIVRVTQDFPMIGFEKLNSAILQNKIKDGLFYLQFPDGQTDSMKVIVRNKEGCDLSKTNFYIDGLEYNGKLAEFAYKTGIKDYKIGAGFNRFKVRIHQ